MDCIFCKIMAGQIPCFKIYEDENVISFLDIYPANPGHALVVTKAHYQNVAETPAEIFNAMAAVGKKLAPLIIAALGMEGFNLFLNDGRSAGQLIEHVHMHIIPRKMGDNLQIHLPQKSYPPGEAEKVQAKILSRKG